MTGSPTLAQKKIWFWLSISVNLGFLGVFKYYNFFVSSFVGWLSALEISVHPSTLSIVLPVGISFYTFHGLSYVIDIYKGKIHPEKNFVDYAVFVSFFPLLVAGPIERATHLLPQIKKERHFVYHQAVDGLRQILWGLFKKVVIADQCAEYANLIFKSPENFSGSTLILGAVFFAFQIYSDFSGYSDIALGTARLFGIELLRNFAYPYFSRDIAEFWRRWHISLSSWFRDYLYFPLGGSRKGRLISVQNTFIIFLVSGFWHGANWTFLAWGLLNALYFSPLLLLGKNRDNLEIVAKGKLFPSSSELLGMVGTFLLTIFAWIFFRSPDLIHAFRYISGIFSANVFTTPNILPIQLFLILIIFIVIEWIGREQKYALAHMGLKWPALARYGLYYSLILLIFLGQDEKQDFIYFQF